MPRLFVAIDLPPAIRDRLAGLGFGIPGARWVDPEQIHLTLRFIGEVDGRSAREIREGLTAVRTKPFPLQLKGVGHFPPRKKPRVLWVGVERCDGLLRLRRRVETSLVQQGVEPEGRKYSPHITLARLNNPPVKKIGQFLAGNNLFMSEPFQVKEFLLYSSLLTPKGAIHTVEAVYPLRP